MSERLIIIGAGGHGRVALDIAKKSGDFYEILFLDDAEIMDKRITIAGKMSGYSQSALIFRLFVAIVNNSARRRIQTITYSMLPEQELRRQGSTVEN